MRKLGIMVVGVAVGLVITGMLIEQERQAAENNADAEKRNGLFAEICGNTVRMYEVKDGRFCGYRDTKHLCDPDGPRRRDCQDTD